MSSDEFLESIGKQLGKTPGEAEEIWNEFFPRLLRFARRKLDDMPCRAFDEEDVALSAMHSFFRGQQAGRFEALDGKHELWRLLVTITARKITYQRRKHLAAKRGGGDVRGESVFVGTDPSQVAEEGLAQVLDADQLPETVEQVVDACQDLLRRLPTEPLRQTAVLRLQGYENREIADLLGCSVARIKQRLASIRSAWGSLLVDPP